LINKVTLSKTKINIKTSTPWDVVTLINLLYEDFNYENT